MLRVLIRTTDTPAKRPFHEVLNILKTNSQSLLVQFEDFIKPTSTIRQHRALPKFFKRRHINLWSQMLIENSNMCILDRADLQKNCIACKQQPRNETQVGDLRSSNRRKWQTRNTGTASETMFNRKQHKQQFLSIEVAPHANKLNSSGQYIRFACSFRTRDPHESLTGIWK